jgi:hypothetical protein
VSGDSSSVAETRGPGPAGGPRDLLPLGVSIEDQHIAGLSLASPLHKLQLHQVPHELDKRVVAGPVILGVQLQDAPPDMPVNRGYVVSPLPVNSCRGGLSWPLPPDFPL